MATSNELYEKGIAILNHFRGSNRDAPIQAPSSYDVMPGLHRLVAEWAFGGTWDRPGLEIKYRSIATISALTVLGREPQLKNHIRNGLAAGVSKEQIAEVILHVMPHGGAPTTLNALNIANEVFKDTPDGVFLDKLSGAVLFDTKDRFNSRTGWLSFTKPVEGSVTEHLDTSFGMVRTEIRSKSSGIHLGHVFPDGPRGMPRYCINATVLDFKPREVYLKSG